VTLEHYPHPSKILPVPSLESGIKKLGGSKGNLPLKNFEVLIIEEEKI
jgi:hypothetical protein